MALLPKRSKYRKVMRGVVKGNATRGNFVAFGDAGLQTLEPGWITARQIEACRIVGAVFKKLLRKMDFLARGIEMRGAQGCEEYSVAASAIPIGIIREQGQACPA